MDPIPVVVDDQEQLPQELANYYTEADDGRFVLNAEGVDSHPQVQNLKSAYQREKEKRQRLAQERDQLQQRAELVPEDLLQEVEPETVQQAIERLRQGDTGEGGDQGGQQQGKGQQQDPAQIRQQVEKRFQREIEQRDEKLQAKDQQIRQLVVDQGLSQALTKARVTHAAYQRAAKKLLADHVQVQEGEDGSVQAVVETDMGEMDLDSYVQQWIATDEGAAFVDGNQGGGARGSGSTSGSRGRKEITREQYEQMSPTDAAEFFRNGGRIA